MPPCNTLPNRRFLHQTSIAIFLGFCSFLLGQEIGDIAYAKHVEGLKKKIDKGFSMVIQKPFVVVGDEPASVVANWAKTVKWAVAMLKNDYFDKDPPDIIDMWLFKTQPSYNKYTKKIFGVEPSTPFGCYLETQKALIMNISTGGGTLVHEIVHPYIRANFPECPTWFDEGLASLYEQCGEKDGHIYGYTNWRLKGLQAAIRQNNVPSFQELTSMSAEDFYGENKGASYGQARYLCYYLQSKKLLPKFYREFYNNRREDPTGYTTLKKILAVEDMKAFKKAWRSLFWNSVFLER